MNAEIKEYCDRVIDVAMSCHRKTSEKALYLQDFPNKSALKRFLLVWSLRDLLQLEIQTLDKIIPLLDDEMKASFNQNSTRN